MTRGSRILTLTFGLFALAIGCGGSMGCASVRTVPSVQPTPDLTGELRVGSRFGLCHACPISAREALSAAHCVDPKPFDRDAPLISGVYSDGDGHEGIAVAQRADAWRDLGFYVPNVGDTFPHTYEVATERPTPGTKVWFLGYDRRDVKRALGPRLFAGSILRIVAGHEILDTNALPGSSGGCVLNAQGQVVGIVDWGMELDQGQAGMAVEVWGDMLNLEPKHEKEPEEDSMLKRLFGDAITRVR